jgi:replication factor A1
LSSLPEKFPEAIVIEVEHVESILEKTAVKKAAETKEFGSKHSKHSKLIGKITQIYDGSGLIQRCPKCNRWIIDNFCIVHSDVEGIWDLRIKARFDDGKERCTLIFKRDVTEKSANITLEEAKKLGEAAMLERIRETLFGKNFEIEGVKLNGGNFLVKDIREV